MNLHEADRNLDKLFRRALESDAEATPMHDVWPEILQRATKEPRKVTRKMQSWRAWLQWPQVALLSSPFDSANVIEWSWLILPQINLLTRQSTAARLIS